MNENEKITQLEKEIEHLKEISDLKEKIARLEGQMVELRNRPYYWYHDRVVYTTYTYYDQSTVTWCSTDCETSGQIFNFSP